MPLELRFSRSASTLRVGLGLLALLFCFSAAPAQAQTRPQSPVPLPTPFTPIVDNANVIDADTRQRLESIFVNLKERGQIEYAVLTVPTTGEMDIFDFSLAVARGWGIGANDAQKAGLLLVCAIQDRKYFTQISYHLEGELPDGLVGQIQRERLVPAFRQGNYSKGIYDTVQAYVATLAAKRGFSVEGIDQRYAYTDQNEQQPAIKIGQSRRGFGTVCCGIIVILFVIILISASSRGGGGRGGRRRRGGGGGLLEALLWGSLIGNLSGGRGWGSSSGWGSSGGFGGGGFGGGGGGGFGGGFGGGGSFGGGGAGGSW